MAFASWNQNHRSGIFKRSRVESKEDNVKLDFNIDPEENAKEILHAVCKRTSLSEGKRINYLNAFVKLAAHVKGDLSKFSLSTESILCCLRVALVNESTLVRAAGLRAIRHIIKKPKDLVAFNKLLVPFLVARSLDVASKNDMERIQALRLMRKVLILSSSSFDVAMARSLVSLTNGGIEEKDRMLRACLACLAEIGALNPELFILSGGVAATTRNLLECQLPKIVECLCAILLFLLDKPNTRHSARVDLFCVAAPYCDFHYRHGWMDKNRDERELRFNCSRLALLSILRSWPGLMQFCNPSSSLGLKAIVDVLYLNQLEVRKALLDLLYELLGLPQPEWTDELSVALSAVDPVEPQSSWRLTEGFVVAEGRSILPHLTRTVPSIIDMHLSLLLYCFLETGLLNALVEVLATSDTFISVRATVLLGELLRLIQIFLPPECYNITPALPNLLGYATTRPQALGAVTALQQLHKLMKRRPASSSLYLDYILQSGTFMKAPQSTEQNQKQTLSHPKSRFHQLIMKDGEDIIRESGVLHNKDAFEWNWNLIKMIVKGETDFKIDPSESTHRSFLKRLVDFYTPSSNKYSHMDLTSKNSQGYAVVGIELIQCLVRMQDAESTKFLLDLFKDISNHISAITSGKSAHDCLFSPQHMNNTHCQTYFLFIGRLGSTWAGVDILETLKIFPQLQDLVTTTNHDSYVKLVVSSLDYKEAGPARELLSAVLKCSVESSRLYATQFLQVLLRAGLPTFAYWGIPLLSEQLKDSSRTVRLAAFNILQEACEVPSCLEYLAKIKPDLLHLEEKGMLILVRFLSIPTGFNALNKDNFVVREIQKWDEYFNYRYVRIVEGETSDSMTLHQRDEDGRYGKRFSSMKIVDRKDLFLPPHLYGQISKHSDGFQLLLEHGSIKSYIHCVENRFCDTERDILSLKVALWAVGHLGSTLKGIEYLIDNNVIRYMIQIVLHCPVYSLRATAFYTLGLLAVTKTGADHLCQLGWICTRHDRHSRYPIIEEEKWCEDQPEGTMMQSINLGFDPDDMSGEPAFKIDYYLNIPDVDINDDEVQNLSVQQKSSTLPTNQSSSNAKHQRSLSESKTLDVLKLNDQKLPEKPEYKFGVELPHRYRDNSMTESTTSGVSSCESVLGKTIANDRLQTLSPIPSSSSLSTLKTSGLKVYPNVEPTRRISVPSYSGTTSSDRSTISPVSSANSRLSHRDLMGYAILRSIRSTRTRQFNIYNDDYYSNYLSKETVVRSIKKRSSLESETQLNSSVNEHRGKHFSNSLSLRSFSSVQKFAVSEEPNKDQVYMGICLPRRLQDLFPEERHISYRTSTIEKRSSPFSEENDYSSSSLSKSKREKVEFVHDIWNCMKCSKRRELRWSNSLQPDELKEPTTLFNDEYLELKCDILQQVQRLSNPVWIKTSRHALLIHKQKHPQLFEDVCVYSEVCKIISQHSYRLGPRRLLQELFVTVNYSNFYEDANRCLLKREQIEQDHGSPVSSPGGSGEPFSDNTTTCNNNKLMTIDQRIVCDLNVECDYKHLPPPHAVRHEPRSSSLSCVQEEGAVTDGNSPGKRNNNNSSSKDGDEEGFSRIKKLDSMNFSYKHNKFPIKNRSNDSFV